MCIRDGYRPAPQDNRKIPDIKTRWEKPYLKEYCIFIFFLTEDEEETRIESIDEAKTKGAMTNEKN